jgi:mannose-6-phosphate isomerase
LADLGFADTLVDNGWLASNPLSELMETYLDRLVGENAFQDFGTQFPVSVKTMEVKARTPLRVNVPDDIARQRYDAFGKTALWYILSADPDATLYLGFSREVEAEDFYRRCLAGKVDDVLHAVHPKAGQTYLIPPCTVYAAGPGLKILEVSEASELALRVYDPGHDDELEEAFDFIDFRPWKEPEAVPGTKGFGAETLAVQEQFRVVKLQLAEPLRISSEGQDRYTIYHCLQGAASVQLRDENRPTETVSLSAGQTVLVPAEVDEFYLVPEAPGTVLLEIQ